MAPKNRAEFRDQIAKEYIQVLEEKNLNWTQGWKSASMQNAVTKRCYNGVNKFHLSLISMAAGYTDPRWATMVQIMDRQRIYHPNEKWHLQAGSTAVYVEYWYPYDTLTHRMVPWSDFKKLSAEEQHDPRYTLRSRYMPVFHASQIDGITPWEQPEKASKPLDQLVQTLSKNMGVEMRHDGGSQAFYRPADDTIHLPKATAFESEYELNATALHELAHATGHESRLNRPNGSKFGTPEYAYEELIAEISSCFMSAEIQTQQSSRHIENHKAYVQSWIQAIAEQPDTLISAIRDAQKVAIYMDFKAELISAQEYAAANGNTMTVPSRRIVQQPEQDGMQTTSQEMKANGDFQEQVDAAISRQKDFSESQIVLGKTPDFFAKYGFQTDLPLVVRSRKLREMHQPPKDTGANRHGLSVEILKKLPEAAAAPAMVLISRTHPTDSIVVVSDMVDSSNLPVVLAIQANRCANVNQINIVVNSLNSAYGRSNFASFLQRSYDENLILSVGKKNSHRLLQSPWLQLPSGLQSGDYIANISRFYEAVNMHNNRLATVAEQMVQSAAEAEDDLEL